MSPKIVRGSVEYEDGAKWKGEFVDGQPGGQGKFTYSDGRVYEGGWSDGQPNGSGKMKYSDGGKFNYYEGEWVNGRWHGNGTLNFRSGSACVGEVQRGRPYDRESCTFDDGEVYEGEWADGRRNGYGKMKYAGGRVYHGNFVNNKKHGSGTMKYTDGRVYAGVWQNNKKHGPGILKEANGDELKREYKHGKLLSSKRIATLTNGPPSQRPRTSVSNMFVLNDDYTTCDICMEEFSFDRNTEDDNVKKYLPVLSKTCDHWFCHGCILGEQGRLASLAENGAPPTWIECMKCRRADEFCPDEPRYDRRLIDMLSRSIPVREEQPGDEGSTIVERDD